MKSLLLSLLVALVGVLLSSGCDRQAGTGDAPANPEGVPANFTHDAADELKSTDLAEECAKDSNAFIEKYGGRLMLVRGRVKHVGEGNFRNSELILEGSADRPREIKCRLSAEKIWSRVLPGQQALLTGYCSVDLKFGSFELVSGTLIEGSGEPFASIPAEIIARAIEADFEAAKKKYSGRSLVITGTVTEQSLVREGSLTFAPKSKSGGLTLKFGDKERDGLKALKAGDSVRALTLCYVLEGEFRLFNSHLLEN